jgi:hypothetical protein
MEIICLLHQLCLCKWGAALAIGEVVELGLYEAKGGIRQTLNSARFLLYHVACLCCCARHSWDREIEQPYVSARRASGGVNKLNVLATYAGWVLGTEMA